MSHLKNKSEISIDAAELLHKNSLYPSVIHCSYYSCFQLMSHIWFSKLGKTEGELLSLKRTATEGSHEVMINQIGIHIRNLSFNYRDFNNQIGQLKKLRHRADYKDEQIDSTLSNDSINLSKLTLLILKKCL